MNTINYSTINDCLSPFVNQNLSFNESWGSIAIKGDIYTSLNSDLEKLTVYLRGINLSSLLKIKIDANSIDIEDVADFITNSKNWEITINKIGLIHKSDDNFVNTFFLSSKSLCTFITGLNTFEKENPFHKNSLLRICVCDITEPLFSGTLEIIPVNYIKPLAIQNKFDLPLNEQVFKHIRVLADKEIIINPNSFTLLNGDIDSPISCELQKHAIKTLASSITEDFIAETNITIDGFRKISLQLSSASEIYSFEILTRLCKAVEWVYKERTITRKKLILERLTIDVDEKGSYISGLNKYLEQAFSQAQSRYNFIILDRKDLYLKELKDLLKDIKGQSDLYSTKIRTLLSNLLRDSLAALLLIGFTIFTKFSDNTILDKAHLLDYVFNALAVYYLISILYQSLFDILDIIVSKKELIYWKKTSRELLPEDDFNKYIKESLKGRRNSLYITYPLIIFSYLTIAFCCYKFPDFFKKINDSDIKLENKQAKHTSKEDSLNLKKSDFTPSQS